MPMRARKAGLQPRNKPVQDRSRATYDAIVETASRILVEENYDALSMNRIISEAGISPGTLYHYFPNREAVALEAFDRVIAQLGAELVAEYEGMAGVALDAVIRRLLALLLDRIEEHQELVRAVMIELPRRESIRRIEAFEQRIGELTRVHLATHGDHGSAAEHELRIWMLAAAAEAFVVRYLVTPPLVEREALIDELARMASLYRGD